MGERGKKKRGRKAKGPPICNLLGEKNQGGEKKGKGGEREGAKNGMRASLVRFVGRTNV